MASFEFDGHFCLVARPPEDREKIDYYHPAIKGFIFTVQRTGTKTFSVKYRDRHGRQRQYKIGNYPDISYDKAKREALKILSRAAVGQNPAEERFQTRRIPRIAELAERYLEYVRTYKRSHAIDARYLRA